MPRYGLLRFVATPNARGIDGIGMLAQPSRIDRNEKPLSVVIGSGDPVCARCGLCQLRRQTHAYRKPCRPAGARIKVENLVGHMTVTQGASFKVTAHVVASGSQAQTLAQGVKLDVRTSGGSVTVHVDYPVNRYTHYRYVTNEKHDKVCVLGIVCFNGSGSSSLDYQGRRVQVYRGQGGGNGAPLHVDVTVQIPAGVRGKFVNDVGLLEADRLANPLSLDTDGGDVYAHQVTGNLKVETDGGDLHVQKLKGNLRAGTDGGDAWLSQSTGNMHLETDGGDGHVSHVTGSLDAETAGGDLHVTDYTSGRKVSLETDGGDVRLVGNLAAARSLNVDTDGGDAILKVGNLSMHLDISSDGGDISVHLPNATRVKSSDDQYSADIGAAEGQGHISSDGGDVTLEQ